MSRIYIYIYILFSIDRFNLRIKIKSRGGTMASFGEIGTHKFYFILILKFSDFS